MHIKELLRVQSSASSMDLGAAELYQCVCWLPHKVRTPGWLYLCKGLAHMQAFIYDVYMHYRLAILLIATLLIQFHFSHSYMHRVCDLLRSL